MTIYTVVEAAKMLRTNPTRVYNAIHSGELKAFKLGQYKVTDESILEFIKNSESKQAV
ncbi:MAG: helix-turn-helix domain-containing protein [Oscillospiraceae bacterium]